MISEHRTPKSRGQTVLTHSFHVSFVDVVVSSTLWYRTTSASRKWVSVPTHIMTWKRIVLSVRLMRILYVCRFYNDLACRFVLMMWTAMWSLATYVGDFIINTPQLVKKKLEMVLYLQTFLCSHVSLSIPCFLNYLRRIYFPMSSNVQFYWSLLLTLSPSKQLRSLAMLTRAFLGGSAWRNWVGDQNSCGRQGGRGTFSEKVPQEGFRVYLWWCELLLLEHHSSSWSLPFMSSRSTANWWSLCLMRPELKFSLAVNSSGRVSFDGVSSFWLFWRLQEDPLFSQYQQLKCDIEPVLRDSDEADWVSGISLLLTAANAIG